MKRSTKWILRLTVYFLLLGNIVMYGYFGDTYYSSQVRNMRVAESRLADVNHLLAQDSRYAEKITAEVYSGRGGSILLYGTVASVEDLRSLIPYLKPLQIPVPLVNAVTLEDGRYLHQIDRQP